MAPLIIAGRTISLASYLDLQQRFAAPLGGRAQHRMSDGSLFIMDRWTRQAVTLAASGWVPPALRGLNLSGVFTVELPLPLTLYAGDVLPSGFVARSAPYGEKAGIDQAGVAYRLVWVKFQAGTTGFSETSDHAGMHSWELPLVQA